MKRTKFKAIKCQLCGKEFLRITNTHLWKEHQITMEEYKRQFPNAPIDAKGLAHTRVTHLRDRSYEEIYGEEQGKELKRVRTETTTKQMQKEEQINMRKEKCGYDWSPQQRKRLSDIKTEHGYSNYRKRALEYYGLECARCGKSTQDPSDFVVHHKDHSNISSVLGNHDLDNLMVLCRSCHGKLHNEIEQVKGCFTGISNIEKGVHYILKGMQNDLGLDLTDENFKDTPKRIARAYSEIFAGVKDTQRKINDILNSAFPCDYNEMIVAKHIETFSMCPHHLLPVHYNISVAYIPSVQGEVLGISKLSRLVEVLSKRPVLQEQLMEDITTNLMTLKGCQGAACIAYGQHYCMMMRGVKQSNCQTVTSSIKGVFYDKPEARQELMELIK